MCVCVCVCVFGYKALIYLFPECIAMNSSQKVPFNRSTCYKYLI